MQQQHANRVLEGVLIPFNGMGRVETRQKLRRANFARLRKRFKTATQMADKLGEGFGSSYVSQLLSGHRGIGDEVADKIEAALGLPEMWLDREDKGDRQEDWDKLVWLWEHADNEVQVMLHLLTGVMYDKMHKAYIDDATRRGEVESRKDQGRLSDAGGIERADQIPHDDN